MGKVNTAFDHIKDIDIIHELSVVLYTDSFFYGLWSQDETLLKADNHQIENLPKLMKIWERNYDLEVVRMMSTVKPYVHLPKSDYNKKYFNTYFEGLYHPWKFEGKKKHKDNFVKEDIRTLHFMDPEVIDDLKKYKMPYKAAHISTALGNYAYLVEEQIVSHISNKTLHIACYKEGEFKFYNQFHCESAEDYLYYYLLILQEFNCDPHKTEICIGGEIISSSKLYTLLNGYFKNIKLVDNQLKSQSSLESPKHLFYDLYLCKSCV